MKRVNIFCEGVTDQKFIADCLALIYGLTIEINNKNKVHFKGENFFGEIIDIGGCDKLIIELHIQKMIDNTELSGYNIVFFDADFPHDAPGEKSATGNNGIHSCRQKLEDIKRAKGVLFDFFLWPNNQDDGEIENCLHKLIPNQNSKIFHCIEDNIACLNKIYIKDTSIKIIGLKEKINYYLYLINASTDLKKRDYKQNGIWDLNFENNPDLINLKNFLDRYFHN